MNESAAKAGRIDAFDTCIFDTAVRIRRRLDALPFQVLDIGRFRLCWDVSNFGKSKQDLSIWSAGREFRTN